MMLKLNFISRSVLRFTSYYLLNILGLSIGLTAFMVIMIQVHYENSYDKFHSKANRIYRVESTNFEPTSKLLSAIHNRPFIEEFSQSSPHVAAATAIGNRSGEYSLDEQTQERFTTDFAGVFPEIVEIFDFQMLEGSADALEDPTRILVPKSFADKHFGNASAIGHSVNIPEKTWYFCEQTSFTIAGVYEDFPKNSLLKNAVYFKMSDGDLQMTGRNHLFFVLLDSPENQKAVVDNYKPTINGYRSSEICLTPLTEAYYTPVDHANSKTGDRNQTRLLIAIALLIITIAVINFTNFSLALAPVRIKSMNTRKILGDTTAAIKAQLILESVCISLLAFGFATVLTSLLGSTSFASLVTADLTLQNNGTVLGWTLGGCVLVGIIAGIYPAHYITSFQPALVLKGSFELSPAGRRLRTALIGMQYVISMVLIISAIFLRLQIHYATHIDRGFETDNIALVPLSNNLSAEEKQATITEQLKQHAVIEDVAFATTILGGSDGYTTHYFPIGEDEYTAHSVGVSPNFLALMNIPVTGGRGFLPADEQRQTFSLIYNEYARKEADIPEGYKINFPEENLYLEVVGFMEDIALTSVRRPVGPQVFITGGKGEKLTSDLSVCYIKIKAGFNVRDALTQITATLEALDPGFTPSIRFYDEVFDNLYRNERMIGKQITWFCLLAVLISMMGVFGLVMFETQYRRKEIGIRKVLGATVADVLALFHKSYSNITFICFLIAGPLATYFVHVWLQNFTYRTPLHLWVYLLSLAIMLIITLVTVSVRTYKTATENPVKAISTE